MIAVIDYGAGNIFSVKNALDYLGFDSLLTNKKEDIEKADGLILPGVGAFPSAMKMLEQSGLTETIKTESKKKPFLGICLGMQLIFQKGYEFEECDGLGLIPGSVRKMEEKDLIIPHMGWNKLEVLNDCPLLAGLDDNSYVYFVHSYKAECEDKNIADIPYMAAEYLHWYTMEILYTAHNFILKRAEIPVLKFLKTSEDLLNDNFTCNRY
mgnify:CR=1 FL=1